MNSADAVQFYCVAKEYVELSGFKAEMEWQASRDIRQFSESDLLRESAWVILCSGFKETLVRRCFPFISLCFFDWNSSALICENADLCKTTAMSRFGNGLKINAILSTASYIHSVGFSSYKQEILKEPIGALRRLPFIGNVTVYHLAKNLGVQTAKPDRHLKRLAARMRFNGPEELCSVIARATGDPVSVVDLVLWRYLERKSTQ